MPFHSCLISQNSPSAAILTVLQLGSDVTIVVMVSGQYVPWLLVGIAQIEHVFERGLQSQILVSHSTGKPGSHTLNRGSVTSVTPII